MNSEEITARVFANFHELDLVQKAAVADLDVCRAELNSNLESQFWRRTAVRTGFAAAEGVLFAIKQCALSLEPIMNVGLNGDELAILREEKVRNGQLQPTKWFISLKDNLRETYRLFGAINHCRFEIETGQGYQKFLAAIAVRDRLMHPKSAASLTVSDADLEACKLAWAWHATETKRLMDEARRGFVAYVTDYVARATGDKK